MTNVKDLYVDESLEERIKEEQDTFKLYLQQVEKINNILSKVRKYIVNGTLIVDNVKTEEEFNNLFNINNEIFELLKQI